MKTYEPPSYAHTALLGAAEWYLTVGVSQRKAVTHLAKWGSRRAALWAVERVAAKLAAATGKGRRPALGAAPSAGAPEATPAPAGEGR